MLWLLGLLISVSAASPLDDWQQQPEQALHYLGQPTAESAVNAPTVVPVQEPLPAVPKAPEVTTAADEQQLLIHLMVQLEAKMTQINTTLQQLQQRLDQLSPASDVVHEFGQ